MALGADIVELHTGRLANAYTEKMWITLSHTENHAMAMIVVESR